MRIRNLLLGITLVFMAGCAPKTMYQWGSYEADLLKYCKHPESMPEFIEHLDKQITRSIKKGRKVPPGLFAELGYFHYKAGDPKKASELFAKEKEIWPESSKFMDRMIEATKSEESFRRSDAL
jgi:hypothetical protein